MQIPISDKAVLRELGRQIAEIGQLPVQKEKAALWRQINRLQRTRPLVWIDEICWWEFNNEPDLQVRCTSDFCKRVEVSLRQMLYKWNHLRVDMIVDPMVVSPYVIRDTGFGMETHAVRSQAEGMTAADFVPIIQREGDVEKIQFPTVTFDRDATEANYAAMCDIFDGVLPVQKAGIVHTWHAPWDQLIQWYGITELYVDMLDRPQLVHKTVSRYTDAVLHRLDQWEKLGCLSLSNGNHRVGSGGLGITDELPAADYAGVARLRDQWGTSTGQIFSEVSPDMHEEFCLQYERKILARYGLNCYGCCEPLHNKIELMRTIPRLRRVSMSPWVNVEQASERMGRQFVFSSKPSPALLAVDRWDGEQVRKALRDVLDKTKGNVVELILKDISTVRNEPQRLWEWAKIAMEVVQDY